MPSRKTSKTPPAAPIAGDTIASHVAGASARLPDGEPDPGIIVGKEPAEAMEAFIAALAMRRHFARETDPPVV